MSPQLIALASALSYAFCIISARLGLRYSNGTTVTYVSLLVHTSVLWPIVFLLGVPSVAPPALVLFLGAGSLQPAIRLLTYTGIAKIGAARLGAAFQRGARDRLFGRKDDTADSRGNAGDRRRNFSHVVGGRRQARALDGSRAAARGRAARGHRAADPPPGAQHLERAAVFRGDRRSDLALLVRDLSRAAGNGEAGVEPQIAGAVRLGRAVRDAGDLAQHRGAQRRNRRGRDAASLDEPGVGAADIVDLLAPRRAHYVENHGRHARRRRRHDHRRARALTSRRA